MADSKQPVNKALLVVAGVIVLGAMIWLRSGKRATEEGVGTITALDVASRHATIEVSDPSTGKTREYEGDLPANCAIKIDDKDMAIGDLKVGDYVRVRARLERRAKTPGGKKKPYMVAEQVVVLRDKPKGP